MSTKQGGKYARTISFISVIFGLDSMITIKKPCSEEQGSFIIKLSSD